MKVTNKFNTTLGFGVMRLLPNETAELPRGYDSNHEVVKYYIRRGWLEVVDEGKTSPSGNSAVNVGVKTGGNVQKPDTGSDEDNGNSSDEDKGDESSLANKNINKLTFEELKTLAAEMGIAVSDGDNKKQLIEKIEAAKNA